MIEVMMKDPAGVILTTAGRKCNQNIKVVPGFDIPEEYNGEYELLVPTVSGVWVFNETPKADLGGETSIIQYLNYKWKSNDFGELTCINLQIGLGGITAEDNNDTYDIYLENEWYGDRTIDFGTEPQEVSEEFYTWLTANAVKQ